MSGEQEAKRAKSEEALSEEERKRQKQEKLRLWKLKKEQEQKEQALKEQQQQQQQQQQAQEQQAQEQQTPQQQRPGNGIGPESAAGAYAPNAYAPAPSAITTTTPTTAAAATASKAAPPPKPTAGAAVPSDPKALLALFANAKRQQQQQQAQAKAKAEEQTNGHAAPMDTSADSAAEANGQADEDGDPLDAFMVGVDQKVAHIKARDEARLREQRALGLLGGRGHRNQRVEENEGFEYPDESELPPSEEDQPAWMKYWSGMAPKKVKELGVPDHSKIDYEPFRKAFFHDVPEISRMSEEEVAQLRFENDNMKVRGKDCPRPIKTWGQAGLNLVMLELLKKMEYEKPTPVQMQALPVILSGRDMLGIAKTGSGKTLAFLLPLFRHVLDQRKCATGEGCIALIMSPTRELALQTFQEASKFAVAMDLRVACVYGGSEVSDNIAQLKRSAEIIICTPGRMIDMLLANGGRVTNLRRCTMVVLDEADRMFDLGFEPQVMRILDNIRPDRQTVMFSATFPRPMEALARKILKKPIEVQCGGRSVVSDTVTQEIVLLHESNKFSKLLELLGHYCNEGSVIIFVDKQEKADELLSALYKHGYPCLALHGAVSQEDRASNLRDFKADVVKILIATSVAARGLDVKQVKLVVNFDCPNHYEDYVHRCGRTGRAGRLGTAFTFITPEDKKFTPHIVQALELSETPVPEDLKAIRDEYVKEQQAQGKKIGVVSGFKGRGYKFSAEEMLRRKETRLLALKAHAEAGGGGGGDDLEDDYKLRERELAMEIEDQVDKLMGRKTRADKEEEAAAASARDDWGAEEEEGKAGAGGSTVSTAGSAAAAAVAAQNAATAGAAASAAATAASNNPKMSEAAARAKEILASKGLASAEPPAASTARLGATGLVISKAAAAAAAAEAIRQKHGITAQAAPLPVIAGGTGGSGNLFSEEVEINDFPQEARIRITGKQSMAEITESTGASLTVRGLFFPPGKQANAERGERKLYVVVESDTKESVNRAVAEIRRIVKEELHTAATTFRASGTPQMRNAGRYNVLAITGGGGGGSG